MLQFVDSMDRKWLKTAIQNTVPITPFVAKWLSADRYAEIDWNGQNISKFKTLLAGRKWLECI